MRRRPAGNVSLGFHDVLEDPQSARPIAPGHTTIYTLSRQQLRTHLNAIRLGAGRDAVRRIDVQTRPAQNSTLLTFDDGALSSYTCVAPELERVPWPGHFFITTNWIGRRGFVNEAQIRELHQRGHAIGSHSCSHPSRMCNLSWCDLVREWSDSCARLSDITGEPVRLASVPGGYYSRTVARAAAVAGIRILFTSEPTGKADWVDGCMVLGRYTIRNHTSPHASAAIACGQRWARGSQAAVWLHKKAVKGIAGQRYEALRDLVLAGTAAAGRGLT